MSPKLPVFTLMFLVLSLVPAAPSGAAANNASLVRIPLKGRDMIRALNERNIEILTLGRDGYLDVVADDGQLDYLYSLGIPVSVIATPQMPSATVDLDANLGAYHTYAEMQTALTDLAGNYPTLAALDVIGTSVEGRNIYMLKISDNVSVEENEPEVLLMGNHHARELMSVDIPLRFAMYLLANYGIDPTVTAMVDGREIFIAPMINPDGHVYVENNHIGIPWWIWWRKNRRNNLDGTFGVDPNRNYGYNWGFDNIGSSPVTSSQVYRGPGPFSEPETQAVRDFCNSRNLSVAFSYHSYGELLLFPWGYVYDYTPDHDVFLAMGDSLAASNGYLVGNPAMGAIYRTNGDTDDWAYGENTTKPSFFCYTPEVNTLSQGGFGPPDTFIQPTFDQVLPMNMLLLELADNPYRVVGPYPPTQFAIDASWAPNYELSWSGNDPSDPNPVVRYELTEYKNLSTIAEDPANGVSNLWKYDGFTASTARAYEGSGSYHSGLVNNTQSTLEAAVFYSVTAETDTFRSWLWYDIEVDYDYAYLEVSTDWGLTWRPIAGNLTTNADPNGNNRGNGITGSSFGWVQAIFPLTSFVGEDIRLRYNYVTDPSVLGEGLYVDLPGPVPTYESKTIIASNVTTTSYLVNPTTTGDFTYVVRARDAEGHSSRPSNSQTHTVTTVTAVVPSPPAVSRLDPNYPNPFNPVTRIPYTVGTKDGRPVPLPVTLTIYSVAGERVTTLIDREIPPGTYVAVWKGRNDAGAPLPSGVYFARLTVGADGPMIRKLVLLK